MSQNGPKVPAAPPFLPAGGPWPQLARTFLPLGVVGLVVTAALVVRLGGFWLFTAPLGGVSAVLVLLGLWFYRGRLLRWLGTAGGAWTARRLVETTALVIALALLNYFLGVRYIWRFDCTVDRSASLSAHTLETLRLSRKEQVEVYCLRFDFRQAPSRLGVSPDRCRRTFRWLDRLLELARREVESEGRGRLVIHQLDLEADSLRLQALVRQFPRSFDVRLLPPGGLVVRYRRAEANAPAGEEAVASAPPQPGADRFRIIRFPDLYRPLRDSRGQVLGSAFVGEGALAWAISSARTDQARRAYFLQGHGEKTAAESAALRSLLFFRNFHAHDLLLRPPAEVPRDCALLLLLGPTGALRADESEALQKYLERGGKLLVALDPLYSGEAQAPFDLNQVLKRWGLLIEQRLRVLRTDAEGAPASLKFDGRPNDAERLGLMPNYERHHPILRHWDPERRTTFRLRGASPVITAPSRAVADLPPEERKRRPAGGEFFLTARIITIGPYQEEGSEARIWAESSPDPEAREYDTFKTPEGLMDLRAPVPPLFPVISVVSTAQSDPEDKIERESGGTRIAAFGDSEALTGPLMDAAEGNQWFADVCLSWLVGRETAYQRLPEGTGVRVAQVERRHAPALYLLLGLVYPGIVGCGGWWFLRRRRLTSL